jgi:hypothetical protein
MSRYKTYDFKCTNRAALIQAIQTVGLPFDESNGNHISLYRYSTHEPEQKASIVISKRHLASAYNDLGFVLQPDGSYEPLVGDYGKGAEMLGKIKQEYNAIMSTCIFKAQGYTAVRNPLPGDAFEIVFTKY